MTKSKSLQT